MPATLLGWLELAGTMVWVVLAAIAASHAVRYKRDPRSAALWVVISVSLPILGAWLYWGFGINRVERRAVRHLGRRGREFDPARTSDGVAHQVGHSDAIGHLESLQLIADRVTRLPMLQGNLIEPLHNGEEAYPRMLKAIRNAEASVTLASYIFDWDEVGMEFTEVLCGAARRGVRVHALLDGVGANRSFSRIGRRLLAAGAEVSAFFPLRFPFGRVRLNLRNHRKIMVVDGCTGFTGGMNISARYMVQRNRSDRTEDLHFAISGPVVAAMQHAFAEDWALATGADLEGDAYYPRLDRAGPAICRAISSGPDEDFEIIHWMLLAALTSARRSVRIVTPYFVPTGPLISALAMAAMRGVQVTLLLPSMVDLPVMRWVADAYLWQLLEHGIRVYRQPPPFVHTKLMVVDEYWFFLGSANLDPRSFRLNFEFNLEVYEPTLAGKLSQWLDERTALAERVTLEQMDARPIWQRIRDGTVKMLSPHL